MTIEDHDGISYEVLAAHNQSGRCIALGCDHGAETPRPRVRIDLALIGLRTQYRIGILRVHGPVHHLSILDYRINLFCVRDVVERIGRVGRAIGRGR